MPEIDICIGDNIGTSEVVDLYATNNWSSADRPEELLSAMRQRYDSFHQQMLTADVDSTGFYERVGFERAGKTVPMWIYDGKDH